MFAINNAKLNKPIYPLSEPLIVGCVKSEELDSDVILYENDSDYILLKVTQLSVLATHSFPTGLSNTALPNCFSEKKSVTPSELPKTCKLYKFLDVEAGEKEAEKDVRDDTILPQTAEIDAEIDTEIIG